MTNEIKIASTFACPHCDGQLNIHALFETVAFQAEYKKWLASVEGELLQELDLVEVEEMEPIEVEEVKVTKSKGLQGRFRQRKNETVAEFKERMAELGVSADKIAEKVSEEEAEETEEARPRGRFRQRKNETRRQFRARMRTIGKEV